MSRAASAGGTRKTVRLAGSVAGSVPGTTVRRSPMGTGSRSRLGATGKSSLRGGATMRSTRRSTGKTLLRRTIDPKTGQVVEVFTGGPQPTVSRADTKVWLLTKRPGPGEYRTASSLGRQLDARKVTAPSTKFPRSQRYNFHNSVWRLTPSQGPKYKTTSSFGRQQASRARTAPSHSFGTSTRDSALKQYGVWSV